MIYKWPTRQEAQQAIPELRPAHPDYVYGPVVLLPGGYAIIVTSKDGRSGFVGETKTSPVNTIQPFTKRNLGLELLLWVLLVGLLAGAIAEYFHVLR
jgi:hypothetical protein